MNFETQERSQCQPDVIALSAGDASPTALNAAALREPPMVGLNSSGVARPFDAGQLTHRQVVGRPVLNVTACGDDLEDKDQTVTGQMDEAPGGRNLQLMEGDAAEEAKRDTLPDGISLHWKGKGTTMPPNAYFDEITMAERSRVPAKIKAGLQYR